VVKFVWRHAIAGRRKPPVIRKDLGVISSISRVMADLVSNFVAMVTGVGRDKIFFLASFNSPTPKNPVIRKDLHGNRGGHPDDPWQDPCCHGNEIRDIIGYNSAYIRDNHEIFTNNRGFSGSGYWYIKLYTQLSSPR